MLFKCCNATEKFHSTEDFILRWGTHYIKSGKFGGRMQIFKTMEASEVASKEELGICL